MATKDDRPGLLSKVAMFVRNPTRDWSELEQPAEGDATGYDKQALKAMIERKRQNDFVRKREFDQLRKLRNRDPGALAGMARPSFFQTSLATDLDGRAVTLKKIDEIEAQMSRQWWKARAQDSQLPAASAQAPGAQTPQNELAKDDSKPYAGPAEMSLPFAATEPMVRGPGGSDDLMNDFAPTQMATPTSGGPVANRVEEPKFEGSMGFSTSALFAIEVDEMATDPELEEAAIRFANSDDTGAEEGLLAALRGPDLVPQAAQSWAAALLDLYRATGNQQGFENAANEFALHLDGVWPIWAPLSDTSAALAPAALATPLGAKGCIWNAPAALSAQAMEDLHRAMASQPMPWHLGWGALQSLDANSMPLLDALFDRLCAEPLRLRFEGHEQLLRVLHDVTPSGDSHVDRSWWRVRLNALRAMGLQDEFELAALDFCVTFELAPPEWGVSACTVELHSAQHVASLQAFDLAAQTVPMGMDLGGASPELPLRGEILGDATQALAVLDAAPAGGKRLFINCSELVRVDFAAAGSLLNWVSMRQAEGKQVQFQNVHRLVAAFFNVIGINEYAKVMPRAV